MQVVSNVLKDIFHFEYHHIHYYLVLLVDSTFAKAVTGAVALNFQLINAVVQIIWNAFPLYC